MKQFYKQNRVNIVHVNSAETIRQNHLIKINKKVTELKDIFDPFVDLHFDHEISQIFLLTPVNALGHHENNPQEISE